MSIVTVVLKPLRNLGVLSVPQCLGVPVISENRHEYRGGCRRESLIIPPMSTHVYKTVELVGSSPVSADDAVKVAIARASETVRNLRWFEVAETRGQIEDGRIAHWQVRLTVGFTLEE